ncbi:hypothetical protein [Curtobacterium luteum]|uniref:hypothetical protein n=1 Tax=Curtobacterium luteum TaxID=33881 RepID=UPI00382AA168
MVADDNDDNTPSLSEVVVDEYIGTLIATGIVRSSERGLDADDYRFDRWEFNFTTYSDHLNAGDDQQVLLGRASVFVLRGVNSADDVVSALDELSEEALQLALGLRRGKVRFDDLLEASFEQTLHDDVLVLDELRVEPDYRSLPLVRDFTDAVLAGPAGRRAVYVLGDPAAWEVADGSEATAAAVGDAGFVRWADTALFIRNGTDVDPIPPEVSLEPEPAPGAALKVEFGTLVLGAAARQRVDVPFPLPPAMSDDVANGRPDGDIVIQDEGHSLAILVPDYEEDAEDGDQLVYEVTFKTDGQIVLEDDVADDLRRWLLSVAERHRTYMARMLAAIDEAVEQVLDGSIRSRDGAATVPVLDLSIARPQWIRGTEIEFVVDETTPDEEANFIAFESRDDGTQVRIGAVRSRTRGSVEAIIDQAAPVADDQAEAALNYLADTGVRALLAGTLTNNLRDAARRAVLGLPATDAPQLQGWHDIFGPKES